MGDSTPPSEDGVVLVNYISSMPQRSQIDTDGSRSEPLLYRSWEKGRRRSTDHSLTVFAPEGVLANGFPAYLKRSLTEIFFGTWFNVLLPFLPLAFLAVYFDLGHGYIFGLSCLALAPLSERLGYITEQLALCTNPTLGGLLNATFSNAPELILSIFALKMGILRVVQLTLLGSILGNILLVVGCAFLFGGCVYKVQAFNKMAATVNAGLLLMAVTSLLFPAVLSSMHTETSEGAELFLSRFTSICMLIAYFFYILFQLYTHKALYDVSPAPPVIAGLDNGGSGDEDDEEDEIVLGFWGGLFWLGICTATISVLSEYLVGTIQGAAEELNCPLAFLSVIVLPVANNVAEHASAVIFAMRNKLDVALGIALGSSTQIAMFVLPLIVGIGWFLDQPLDLDFRVFATVVLLMSVLVVAYLVVDGESNWLKGLMLVLMYVIVSASFFVHKDAAFPAPGPTPPLNSIFWPK